MGNAYIVVEEGVIKCEHGGKVILVSTVPNHVIGGKKPLFDKDLLNAAISGCPNPSTNGGPCTKVVAISSAVTESNVSNNGTNYLLRTDGCKTDKGVALILSNPGQGNTRISVKSSGSSQDITIKALEDAQLETSINIAKERHRIYPLRKSSEEVRALRGARDFRLLSDYYSVANGTYKNDKLVTYTEAYLYVTDISKDETKEYKVVNRGDLFNPQMYYVQFKDTQTKVLRRYIPFYEESGDLEFVYSNVKLTDKDRAKFTTTRITIESKKNSCIFHHKEYSKNIKLSEKVFKKHIYSAKDIKENSKSRKYLSTIIFLDDPVGEVEDLYNEYEFSYSYHYGQNKSIIDDLRAKNQYPYAVADLLEYLYVDEKEQTIYDEQIEELKTQYEILLDGVQKLGSHVVENMIGLNLGSFIDYKTAKDYMDEVKFIDKGFFKRVSKNGIYNEKYFRVYIEKLVYFYAQDEDKSEYSRGFNSKDLFLQGKGYLPKGKENASDALAYVTFTLCYSPKHKEKLEEFPELKAASETFYYLLKNAKALPQINEKTKEDIFDEMKYQKDFIDMITGKDSLLGEFENLDNYLKEIAFNPKAASSEKAKKAYGFKSLKAGSSAQEIFYKKDIKNPQEILKDVATSLKNKELSSVLDAYKSIEEFDSDEDKHNYYHYLLNLSYVLIAPRAKLDAETQEVSLFNNDNKAIQTIILHLTNAMNSLGEEKAQALHDEPIKQYYLEMLFALITHAKVEKPNYKYDSFDKKGSLFGVLSSGVRQDKGREANLSSFLESFSVEEKKQEINTSNINDQNYDNALKLKTDSTTLYEKLKKIDGISSYVSKFDESVDDFGGKDSELNKKFQALRKTTAYKSLLASSKVLSFFMVAGNIAEFTQGKKRINLTNLVNFAGDLMSVSGTVVNIARDPVVKLTIPGTRGLSRVTVPESLEHVAKLNKIVSASTMKVIARFGLIGPMVGAVNELSEISLENNKDYFIAVGAKNAIYLGLLFSPALVAFGAVVLTEIVWYFLKDSIENSKMELYLYDSLLFNTTQHNDKHFFNEIESSKSYRASIFLEALKSSNKVFKLEDKDIASSELKGFSSSKEIREFIADNYDTHSSIIDTAMLSELSQLKSVLYGYSVKKEEIHNNIIRLQAAGVSINLHSPNSIKLSESLYRDVDEVYLSYTKLQPNDKQEQYVQKIQKAKTYDVTGHIARTSKVFEIQAEAIGLPYKTDIEKKMWMQSASQSTIMRQMLEDVAIIFKSENVTIKYEIEYNVYFQSANNYAEIKELKSSSLTQEDYKCIKELDA
ncbi:hypothetical protein [Sulfurimonas sp.]|uniref:hypothetical protein n=1 Tax=Sulfurimonas sp. TaxID=2022749 RepID=UPI002B47D518|nr:hypothetical protein [Sulfurimonas sp.]